MEKILVIDDDEKILELVQEVLKNEHYIVETRSYVDVHFTELSGRHSVLERPRSEMKRSFIPQSSFKSMARAKAGINAPLTGFQTVDYSNQAEQRIVLLMSIQ